MSKLPALRCPRRPFSCDRPPALPRQMSGSRPSSCADTAVLSHWNHVTTSRVVLTTLAVLVRSTGDAAAPPDRGRRRNVWRCGGRMTCRHEEGRRASSARARRERHPGASQPIHRDDVRLRQIVADRVAFATRSRRVEVNGLLRRCFSAACCQRGCWWCRALSWPPATSGCQWWGQRRPV
jgi:hypothetical protein